MIDVEADESAAREARPARMPTGALLTGAVLVVLGVALTLARESFGMLLVQCGVLLICTGLIQRTLHRLLR